MQSAKESIVANFIWEFTKVKTINSVIDNCILFCYVARVQLPSVNNYLCVVFLNE